MMNWSSLGALVLIRMKAVWLSTSLEEKLALITPFVSKGGISWKVRRRSAWVTVTHFIFKSKIRLVELTQSFPVPPCWPVGSSRCRSPPLEYISTTWRKTQQRNPPQKYEISPPTLISWSTQKQVKNVKAALCKNRQHVEFIFPTNRRQRITRVTTNCCS